MDVLLGGSETLTTFIGGIIGAAIIYILNWRTGGRLRQVEAQSGDYADLISGLKTQVDHLEKELERREETYRAEIQRLEQQERQRESLYRESIHAYELQLAEQRGRIISLENQTAEYRSAADKNTEERVRLVVRIEALQKNIEELRTSANANAEQLRAVTSELEAVRREKTALEASLARRIQEATTPLIAENQQLKAENMHLRRQVYNLNQLLEKKPLPDTDLLIDTSIPADPASEEKPAEASPESAGV
ncbi:MAG: hypothetical protein K8I82_11535 [Anaerolineae bacterium]|nr:hypothetical protein [Anaerolineae bacterium]